MKWKIHRVVPLLTLLALGHARSAAAQSAAAWMTFIFDSIGAFLPLK